MNHDCIMKDFENIIKGLKKEIKDFDADIKIINNRPAVETEANNPFVELGKKVAKEQFGKDLIPEGISFYTDAAVFLPQTNLPAIIYGPGEPDMAHQPNEHITIEDLWESVQFYIGIILKYLA